MRILHTADWHLGRRLQEFSRMEEQILVLDEIVGIAQREKVDLVLIAGDLFDNFNPPTDAVELFYDTLYRLSAGGKRAVIAIAGNHDSPERIEAPHPLAKANGILLFGRPYTEIDLFTVPGGLTVLQSEAGFVELQLPGINYPVRLLLTPYANEVTLRKALGKEQPDMLLRKLLSSHWKALATRHCNSHGVNLLMAHLYLVDKNSPLPPEGDDEKSILHQGGTSAIYSEDIPSEIQYTALGHLHRPQEIPADKLVVYSGSPLSYSFSEADQNKQVEIVDLEPGGVPSRKSIPLKKGRKLTRQRFEDLDGAINWLEDHHKVYVELTLATENYLGAEDKKRLYQSHKGIVSIIPEISAALEVQSGIPKPNLEKSIKSLFIDYFQYKKGQPPTSEILDLLDEIINTPA